MIKAFGLLQKEIRNEYQLVIVCALSDDQALMLRQVAADCGLAESLVLTNYVPKRTLLLLYNCCDHAS